MVLKRLGLVCLLMSHLIPRVAAAQSVQVHLATGQPTYEYPIAIPPGINGAQPALALSYGGGAEQSPVGLGWRLSGLSLITRCGPTFALDGANGAPKAAVTDKLCLDGQRLIPTDADGVPAPLSTTSNDAAGRSGTQFADFRTEVAPYRRVRVYGIAEGDSVITGPKYFKVWDNNGGVHFYGDAPGISPSANATIVSSKVRGGSNRRAVMWRLSRSTDVAGNDVDYKYETTTSRFGSRLTSDAAGTPGWESVIREIRYGHNRVVFSYVAKAADTGGSGAFDAPLSDGMETIFAETKMVDTRNLATITTYVNDPAGAEIGVPGANAVAVRSYQLQYTVGMLQSIGKGTDGSTTPPTDVPVTGRTRLSSIQECAGGPTGTRSCFRPTAFGYQSGTGRNYGTVAPNDFSLRELPLVSQGGTRYGAITLDHNGDGRTDILRWSSNTNLNELHTGLGNGGFVKVASAGLSGHLLGGSACVQTQVTDFDQDGLPDLFVYSATGKGIDGTTTCNRPPSYFLRNNGDGSFLQVPLAGLVPNRQYATATRKFGPPRTEYTLGEEVYLGDLTGDGIPDILTTRIPAFAWRSGAVRPDPCLGLECTRVYRGNGNGTFTPLPTNLAAHSLYDMTLVWNDGLPSSGPILRDINRDDRADLYIGGRWPGPGDLGKSNVLLSNGDGSFTDATYDAVCEGGEWAAQCRLDVLDYNGDGVLDLVSPGRVDGPANKLYLGGIGDELWAPALNFNVNLAGGAINLLLELFGSTALYLDMNQDGKDDLVRLGSFSPNSAVDNQVWLSRGNGEFTFDEGFYFSLGDKPMRKPDGTVDTLVGNFTGLGGIEFIVATTAGNTMWVKSSRGLPDKLTSVTDVSSMVTRLVHVPLAKSKPNLTDGLGDRYVGDRGTSQQATGSSIDLPPPSQMSVVATVLRPTGTIVGQDGSGPIWGSAAEEYAYGGLKFDRTRRVGLGYRFAKRQVVGSDAAGTRGTTFTTFVQQYPYVGAISRQETYLGDLTVGVPPTPLLRATNVHCDAQAGEGEKASALTSGQHCPTAPVLKRPYTPLSTRTEVDLSGAPLPGTRTETTVNAEGAVTRSTVSTEFGGERFVHVDRFDYHPDIRTCDGDGLSCTWQLSRVKRHVVERNVARSLPSVTAGTGPHANVTDGNSLAPGVAVAPATHAFDGRPVANRSDPKLFTVTNTGSSPLTVTQVQTAGGDFRVESNACSTVQPQGSCTIGVSFMPSALGDRSGSLRLSHNSAGGATTIPLTGVGTTPTAFLVLSDFGGVRVGTPKVLPARLENRGSSPFTVTPVAMGAVPDAPGYRVLASACAGPLAAGGSCLIDVEFRPLADGASSGTLTVATSFGPASAALMGTGIVGKGVLSASTMSFSPQQQGSESATRTIRLTNSGSDALDVTGAAAEGDFAVRLNECTRLAPAASCDVHVAFAPTASGPRSGTLRLSTNGDPQQLAAALTGSGINLVLSLEPSPIDFGVAQTDNLNQVRTVAMALRNDSDHDATGLSWVRPDWMAFEPATPCNGALAARGTCTFTARFDPAGSGQYESFVEVRSQGKALRTTARGEGRLPSASLTGGAFADVPADGSSYLEIDVVLTNTGVYTIPIGVLPTAVEGSPNFTLIPERTNCATSLIAGESCKIRVRFKPSGIGPFEGHLTVTAHGQQMGRPLTARGTGAILDVNPNPIDFGQVLKGRSVTSAPIYVTNDGNLASGNLSIALPPDHQLVDDNCSNRTRPPGEGYNCSFKLKFTSSGAASQGGTVSISDGIRASTVLSTRASGVVATLAFDPAGAHDFGDVPTGATGSTTMRLRNTSAYPATLPSLATSAGPYRIAANACQALSQLDAQGQCSFDVVFEPGSTLGTLQGEVRASSSSADAGAVRSVVGNGVPSAPAVVVSPAGQSLGSVQWGGSTSAAAFAVVNNGGPAAGLTFEVATSDPVGFALIAGTGACVNGMTLASGGSCTLRVNASVECPPPRSHVGTVLVRQGTTVLGSATVSVNVVVGTGCRLSQNPGS